MAPPDASLQEPQYSRSVPLMPTAVDPFISLFEPLGINSVFLAGP